MEGRNTQGVRRKKKVKKKRVNVLRGGHMRKKSRGELRLHGKKIPDDLLAKLS